MSSSPPRVSPSKAPAEPLDLPERVRAWSRGRSDRVVCLRADGSVTLTMLLPSETLEARFADGAAAAAALAAHAVAWTEVPRRMAGTASGVAAGRRRQA